MAIIYDNGAQGTLKPPILNNITEINSPLSSNLELNSSNNLTLNSVDSIIIGGEDVFITGNNSFEILTNNQLNIVAENATILANTNFIIAANTFTINSSNFILINTGINFASLTTTNILLITPIIGMQIFCSTINQMVFYQVSPITGITLGWYNSTGTIQL
jgi:hypothetical protein